MQPDVNSFADELRSILGLYSLSALKRLTRSLNLPTAASKRDGFIGPLAEFLGTPAHVRLLEKRLAPRDWLALDVVPLRIGALTIQGYLAALRDREFSPSEALAELERLMLVGGVVPVDSFGYGGYLNLDQSSLRGALATTSVQLTPGLVEVVRSHRQERPRLSPVAPPTTPSEGRAAELSRAVFILLSEASRKPIRMTAQGSPYKSEITRLADALAAGPATAGRGGKRGRAAAAPPAVLWFALGALLAGGLLEPVGQEMTPSADASTFLVGSPDERARRLLFGWINSPYDEMARIASLVPFDDGDDGADRHPWRADGADPSLDIPATVQRGRAVVVEAFNVASESNRNAWYAIDDLASLAYRLDREMLFPRYQAVAILGNPGYRDDLVNGRQPENYFGVRRANAKDYPTSLLQRERDWREVEGAFVRQVAVESLDWLGVFELGSAGDTIDRFRLTPFGQRLFSGAPPPARAESDSHPAVVQPNFDVVVVDAWANTDLLAQLEELAQRRSIDRAATYHLAQADLLRGLDRGWTETRIFELLESASGRALPQNVAFTLREWIAAYERLTVRESACLLEADSPAQLDAWLSDRGIAPLLGSRLGPTSILVPAAGADRLLAALASRKAPAQEIDYRGPLAGVVRVRDPDLVEIRPGREEPYLSYRLAELAEPVDRDPNRRLYRITRDSVHRGARGGRTGAEMAEFLSRAAGGALPIDFYTRLYGWSASAPALVSETLVAVGIPEPPLDWATLRSIPSIGRLIHAVPLPRLALVKPADLPALTAELAERGIALAAESIPATQLEWSDDDATAGLEAQLLNALRDPSVLFGKDLGGLLAGGPRPSPSRARPRR